MLSTAQVVLMPNKSVYDDIRTFIRYKERQSKNTAKAYENDIRLFFSTQKGKRLEELQENDLIVSYPDLLEYRNFLSDTGKYKNITINRKINSIKSLYQYLKASEYNVNYEAVRLLKDLKDDTSNTGFLTPEEAELLSELALTEQRDGEKKKVLIRLACVTSIRKDALLKIKPKHIKAHESKKGIFIISSDELFDKGKMINSKEIKEDLYHSLLRVHGDRNENQVIFNFSGTAIDDMMKRIVKKAGIDPKRNITFHSFKKAGVKHAYDVGGLRAAQIQAGHSSPTITSKSYLEKETNIAIDMFEHDDCEVYDKLSREQLLELVKSFGNGIGVQLKNRAIEIYERK